MPLEVIGDPAQHFLKDGKSIHGADVRYVLSPESIKAAPQDDGSLVIEGWASTNAVDSYNEIVEPEAFQSSLSEYLGRPILLAMHDWYGIPIGKVLDAVIKPLGLWVKAKVLPTGQGNDIILLIKNGVLRSFSVGFRLKKYEDDVETGIRRILDLQLLEISVVNVPANPFADFSIAKSFSKELEKKRSSINNIPKAGGFKPKGVRKMDPELKEALDSSIAPVKEDVDKVKVTVTQVQKQVDGVGKMHAEMKTWKEGAERSAAETKEFVEKFAVEFKNAVGALEGAVKEMNTRNVQYGAAKDNPYSVKELIEKPVNRLKRVFTKDTFGKVEDLHFMNDTIVIVDGIKCASKKHGGYAMQPIETRLKSLKIWKEWEMMTKAMDTSTSNEGTEYLPTGFSSTLVEMVKQDLLVAGMHPEWTMTNASQYLPVEGADTLATRATQTTAVVSSLNTTEQTPGSANVLFTAEKLRGRTQFSGEADEDLIISVAEYIRMKVARSIARAKEKAIINGDDAAATSFDSGDVPGATDARYCWNGYRGYLKAATALNSGNDFDLSTWSEKNVNAVRKFLGKYGKAKDIFWLTSLTAYLMHCLDPDEMPNFRSIDKYGPQATVITGELGKINGSPLIESEFVLDTWDANGVYSGAGQTKTALFCVNRPAFWMGNYGETSIEVVRNALDDVYDIVAYSRCDFKNVYAATEDVVAEGINVSTT